MDSITTFWLVVLVLSLIIEAATLGLATIWFAFGALIAWLLAVLNLHLAIQIFVFFGISFVLLYFTRPLAIKVLKIGGTKTNYESLIGRTCIVTETINNMKGQGAVKVDGNIWSARALQEEVIDLDTIVEIKEVKGVKLIVVKKMEG